MAIGEPVVNLADQKTYVHDGSTVFEVGSNVTSLMIGSGKSLQSFIQTTTTGTSTQTVDSFPVATWRTAGYLVSIKDNAANNFQTAMVNLLYDGSVSTAMAFGVLYSNTYLGTFSATANATHALLQFTPTSANTTLSMARTTVTV